MTHTLGPLIILGCPACWATEWASTQGVLLCLTGLQGAGKGPLWVNGVVQVCILSGVHLKQQMS